MSKKPGCRCIERVNKKLAGYNGLLEINLLANPSRAMISICKRELRNRKKPPLMEASFCPFCGSAYPNNRKDIAKAEARGPAGSYLCGNM